VLGYTEFVLLPVSIGYLVLVVIRAGRARAARALILAGVLALTIAQPFGVKGVPISPQEFTEGDTRPADADAIHSVRVLGVPLFGFRPYTREISYLNGEGGYPSDWLKVRSWLWPGLLTNGTKVERLCGNDFQPCWVPEDQSQEGFGRASNLQLVEADGEWRYRILRFDGSPPEYPPPRTTGTYGYNGYYRLAGGIVSTAGVVYWLLVGGLGALILIRIRRSPASKQLDGSAEPS
jgi:hypothetical protein